MTRMIPYAFLGLVLAVVFYFPGAAAAARPVPPSPVASANVAIAPADPADPRELAAFLDPIFARAMADLHVPGAVFVLVKDRRIVFSRGYGYRNLESGAPVDPDRTVFHIDSLSKLVTATAVLQLADRGRVRLDQDVNTYLTRLHVPRTYPQSVTLAGLLTHTAGLDYDLDDLGGHSPSPLALRDWDDQFLRHPPVPVLPPGQQYLYSNAAYSLLGEVVANVSGRPFDQYVAENIYSPLQMSRSSFQQPSPLVSDLATSYSEVAGVLRPVADDYLDDAPARAMTTTATDIAHFMIAELSDGQYGSAPILSAHAVQDQNRQHFTFDPSLPGATYAFQEWPTNQQRVLGHHGANPGRHSALALLPDQHLGFFLASNREGYDLFSRVFDQFMDHFYPVPSSATSSPPTADFSAQSALLVGTYRSTAYSHRTIAKLLLLVSSPAEVQATGPGSLTISLPDAVPVAAHAVGPRIFQLDDGHTSVAFTANARGDITQMIYYGLSAYEKVAWYETATVQTALFGLFFLIFLLSAFGVPYSSRSGRRTTHSGPWAPCARVGRAMVRVVGGLNAVWLIVLFTVLLERDQFDFGQGLPLPLTVVLALPVVTSAVAVVLIVFAAPRWHRRDLSLAARASDMVFTLAALAFIPFLASWNLLGVNV